MPSVQPKLVPYAPSTTSFLDLLTCPEALAVWLHHANRFFALDYSSIVVSGRIDDDPRSTNDIVKVVLMENDEVWRSVNIECCYAGTLMIRPLEGRKMADCIGRDILGDVQSAWLTATGFHPDHPVLECVNIKGNGELILSLQPVV